MIRDVRHNGKIVGHVVSVKSDNSDSERKVMVTFAITDPDLSEGILNGIDYSPIFFKTEKGSQS